MTCQYPHKISLMLSRPFSPANEASKYIITIIVPSFQIAKKSAVGDLYKRLCCTLAGWKRATNHCQKGCLKPSRSPPSWGGITQFEVKSCSVRSCWKKSISSQTWNSFTGKLGRDERFPGMFTQRLPLELLAKPDNWSSCPASFASNEIVGIEVKSRQPDTSSSSWEPQNGRLRVVMILE